MRSDTSNEQKIFARERTRSILNFVNIELADREFLLGDRLTVADCYLFWTLTLTPFAGVSLDKYSTLAAFQHRLSKRPIFASIMEAERQDFVMIKSKFPNTEFTTNPALR
jgi:glutathione S-transferase